jgi:hypothetical protein
MNIKEIVKDNVVRFLRLRHGIAYCAVIVGEQTMQFPVPLSDIGDATLASGKAATP